MAGDDLGWSFGAAEIRTEDLGAEKHGSEMTGGGAGIEERPRERAEEAGAQREEARGGALVSTCQDATDRGGCFWSCYGGGVLKAVAKSGVEEAEAEDGVQADEVGVEEVEANIGRRRQRVRESRRAGEREERACLGE
jgi:hypothetical protein